MEKSSEFLETLIISEITGMITEQEKKLLQRIIIINPEAKKLYDEMYSLLTDENLNNAIQSFPQRFRIDELQDAIPPPSKKKLPHFIIGTIFILLSIICITFLCNCLSRASPGETDPSKKLGQPLLKSHIVPSSDSSIVTPDADVKMKFSFFSTNGAHVVFLLKGIYFK